MEKKEEALPRVKILGIEKRSDYCLGHFIHFIPEWCPRCVYDEKNRYCLGYKPVVLTLISVAPVEQTSTQEGLLSKISSE